MTPGKHALAIYRGDTFTRKFTLWADAAKTVEVDLTGAVVKAEIRDKPGGAVLGELTCVITLPNIIDASLTAAESALLASGVWDLQVTFLDGTVSTYLTGAVTVTPDITDSSAALRSSKRLRSVG